MKCKNYILDDKGNPVLVTDLATWARWFDACQRHVADETIGASRISTVFLALDHAFDGGPPVLWETMVFGGPLDQEQDRCSGSREQAEAMHARMVEKVKQCPNTEVTDRLGGGSVQ